MNTFERDGISFRYPVDWTAEAEEDAVRLWTIQLPTRMPSKILSAHSAWLQDEAGGADEGGAVDEAAKMLHLCQRRKARWRPL